MRVAVLTDVCSDVLNRIVDHAPDDIHVTICTPTTLGGLSTRTPDVVHLDSRAHVAVSGLIRAWQWNASVVATLEIERVRTTGPWHRRYLRTVYSRCRRLFVSSMIGRNLAVSMQLNAAPLVLWRKGVDAKFFHPSKRSAALRERWRVSEDRPAILYAGSLSDRETFRHLVSLEAALRRSQPIHRLIVAGDGPILHDLQAKCRSAAFTGPLTSVDLAEAMASSDLFVMPGDEDGAAAVLQAQASGLPVVVMEQTCASEYVSDHGSLTCGGLTDFLVDTATLIRNPARYKAMRPIAREHSLKWEWRAGLEPLYASYREVAHRHAPQRQPLRRNFKWSWRCRPSLDGIGRRPSD
jgi:glycosyltransferase involved in cell wall biosynthesis